MSSSKRKIEIFFLLKDRLVDNIFYNYSRYLSSFSWQKMSPIFLQAASSFRLFKFNNSFFFCLFGNTIFSRHAGNTIFFSCRLLSLLTFPKQFLSSELIFILSLSTCYTFPRFLRLEYKVVFI